MTTGRRTTRRAGGFTLMEMMVVVALIITLMSMTLPSIIALFNAGADANAYNLMAALLTNARATAIREGTYVGVHVQLADARDTDDIDRDGDTGELLRPKEEGVCWVSLVVYDPNEGTFDTYGEPTPMPGSICFGKLADGTISSQGDYTADAEDVEEFTTFTVVFSPYGSATRTVQGGPVRFDPQAPAFRDQEGSLTYTGSRRLWKLDDDYSQDQYAVTAMTMFDFGKYADVKGEGQFEGRKEYLNEAAQFLPLNVHTGQLMRRE